MSRNSVPPSRASDPAAPNEDSLLVECFAGLVRSFGTTPSSRLRKKSLRASFRTLLGLYCVQIC